MPDDRTARRVALLLGLCAALAAPVAAAWTSVDAGRGAVPVRFPGEAAPGIEWPLLVLLHGYGANGPIQEGYLGLGARLEAAGFVYALPDGTENPLGDRFWNATDACCDLFGSGVDDAGYLTDLLDAIAAELPIDPRRIAFFGHSNGGFMAYRMACSHAERIAAAASLAGATYADPGDCVPSRELRILQIHGTEDATVLYGGGQFPLFEPYPGAEESVALWADSAGCSGVTESDPPFDAHAELPGAETEVLRYEEGCGAGGAELWTIVGGEHVPPFTDEFRDRFVAWLALAVSTVFRDGFETGTDEAWSP
jgi:polyhydroxybutyrate depolymerase